VCCVSRNEETKTNLRGFFISFYFNGAAREVMSDSQHRPSNFSKCSDHCDKFCDAEHPFFKKKGRQELLS